MKHSILILLLAFVASFAFGQSVVQLRGDTIKMYKVGGNAELILQNATRSRAGAFLMNDTNGRTKFMYAVDSVWKHDDTVFIHRADTTISFVEGSGGGGGSGTVNSGTQYRIPYYATTGTTLSEASAITGSRALISDANGVPTHASTTAAQINYLSSTTSDVQAQINGKLGISDTSNKWLTSAHKRLDSVFVVKGGNEIFVYKDAGPLNQSDGLIIGGVVTWTGTGLVFDVTPATYVIDGLDYESSATTITLDVADGTFGRYDAIIVNSSGVVSKITGDAAASPVFPQIDPATEILLTYVFVDAGATTPTQISDVVIYDENTEWTTSSTGGATVNFASSAFANHGTKSIAVTWAGSSGLLFTNGSSLIGSNYLTVSFYLRLTATMANNVNVAFQFYNGSTAVSNGLNAQFSKLTVGSWQLVSFNISQFTFSGAFNRIKITLTGTNASTVYFDWVRLQGSTTPQPPQGLTNAYSSISDGTNTANATGADGFKLRSADNKLSIVVANNDATHGDNALFTVNQANLTLTESQVTNLTTDLAGKVTANGAITGATKTKITYDSKGLVTAGADATTSDIAEGSNLYFTDARAKAAVILSKSIIMSNPTTTENNGFYTDVAITVSKVASVVLGSGSPSITWQINHASTRDNGSPNLVFSSSQTTTSTSGTTTTTFNDNTIPAGSYVWVTTSAKSGTVNQLEITLTYTND